MNVTISDNTLKRGILQFSEMARLGVLGYRVENTRHFVKTPMCEFLVPNKVQLSSDLCPTTQC